MLTRLTRPFGALVLLMTLMLAAGSVPDAQAEDIALRKVLANATAGGAIGALVGTAILAFADHPGDKLEFITTGAALGVLAGVGWGFYDSSRSYVSYEDGRFSVAMGQPVVERVDRGADRQSGGVMVVSKLVAVGF